MASEPTMGTGGSTGPASTQWAERQRRWAQGWRRWIFPYVFMAYLAATAIGVWQYSEGAGLVAGYVILAAFCACYVEALHYAIDEPRRQALSWLVGAMIVLCAAEVPLARSDAFVMGVFIVVPAIASFGKRSWPVVAVAVIAPLVVPPIVASWHSGPALDTAVSIALTALALYAFFQVVGANRELSAARAEIARLAADTERTRISRDLHDLLGHSLTAITMKAQLARRLAGADVGAVARELEAIEALSRQALADVRAAVSSYREVTLAGELAQARELLRACGIVAELPTATEVTDPAHDELLAWAVREGVTNVVRHAKATSCRVELGRSWIEITDDGTATTAPVGNGLLGLQERVLGAGGTVQAGPARPRGWRLRVDLAASPDPLSSITPGVTPGVMPR
ncbi:MAG: sensor histidine kinase [Acidimicrobiales bacterium]